MCFLESQIKIQRGSHRLPETVMRVSKPLPVFLKAFPSALHRKKIACANKLLHLRALWTIGCNSQRRNGVLSAIASLAGNHYVDDGAIGMTFSRMPLPRKHLIPWQKQRKLLEKPQPGVLISQKRKVLLH